MNSNNKTAFCGACRKLVFITTDENYDDRCDDCDTKIELDNYNYDATCHGCGKLHRVFTQSDAQPEYRSTIRVLCECGNLVEILIPVWLS